jgi:hypothetical protein
MPNGNDIDNASTSFAATMPVLEVIRIPFKINTPARTYFLNEGKVREFCVADFHELFPDSIEPPTNSLIRELIAVVNQKNYKTENKYTAVLQSAISDGGILAIKKSTMPFARISLSIPGAPPAASPLARTGCGLVRIWQRVFLPLG